MPNEKRNLQKLLKAPPEAPKTQNEQFGGGAVRIAHAFEPVRFAREALDFHPDPWQARLLNSTTKKIIVNVARQQGKSETASIKALHRAVFWPKSLILIVAPALPQALELRLKIGENLRRIKGLRAATVTDNKRELEFDNGSRIIIVAADQDTVRSYTAHMIIEDEAAIVPDAIYEAMEPMILTTNGQHILLSTPKGMRKHHFPDIWHNAKSIQEDPHGWDKYEVACWSNPRVPRAKYEAIREEKELLGRAWWFHQEYECSFVAAASGLVYPYDKTKNSCPALPRPDREGWHYVLGIDYGYTDATAYVVLGWRAHDPNVYVVETIEKTKLLAGEAAEIAKRLSKKYAFDRIVGDVSMKGYLEEARQRFMLPIEPAQKTNKRGYIELMASDLKAGLMKVMDGNAELVREWQTIPWDEARELPQDGYKDHLADACLYAWRACLSYLEETRKEKPKPGTPEAYLAEADEMLEQRIRDVTKKDSEWWDEKGEAGWLENAETGASLLN